MRVSPRSSRSMGPLTLSTVANAGLLPVACGGEPSRPPRSLRVAGVVALGTRAGVDHHADEDAERGNDEGHDQPDDNRGVEPVSEDRAEEEGDREQNRKPLPAGGRGVAEADAGEEEEDVGGDSHMWIVPRRPVLKSRVPKRGSQDSNLESPVLETGALAVWPLPLGSRF